ncbi:HEAT repeat domain-containing protein [bacterium]|nr:HEAT repeat domain-containing protein [bacterium]
MIRLAAALGAGLLLAGAAAAQPRALGTPLLAALDAAPVAALVRIDGVQAIDGSGWTATATVLRPLRGAAAGEALPVLWEELARGRPPRLANGDTVLLALVEPPSGSLWKQRLLPRPGARAIAGDGDAMLRQPAPRDVELLVRYAALPAGDQGAPRAAALLEMAGSGSPLLAALAIERLREAPQLAAALPDAGVLALLDWAADGERAPSQRAAIVALVGGMRRPAARPALEQLARPGGALEAEALTALAAFADGLPAARAEALLERREPAIRAVGVRALGGPAVERRLPALARSDPDPRVRAAAAVALADTRTTWGVDACVPALADGDPSVRSAAAEALGRLGAAAVPQLEDVARTRPAEARGALTALALAGPSGEQALRRLMVELPDPTLRQYARLALGQGPRPH